MIHRITLQADHDCDSCGCPIMQGEVAYRDDRTGAVGHTLACVTDRAGELEDEAEHALFLTGFDRNQIAEVR